MLKECLKPRTEKTKQVLAAKLTTVTDAQVTAHTTAQGNEDP